MFIALLVAVLAKQVPLETPEVTPYTGTRDELLSELSELPDVEALQGRVAELDASIEAFRSKGVVPQATTLTTAELLAERNELMSREPQDPEIPTHKVHPAEPSFRPLDTLPIIVKDEKVYMGQRVSQEQADQILQNGAFTQMGGVTMLFDQSTGEPTVVFTPTVGISAEAAIKRMQSLNYPAETTRFVYFVYPDSVNTFHSFREAALELYPQALWAGTPFHKQAKLYLVQLPINSIP